MVEPYVGLNKIGNSDSFSLPSRKVGRYFTTEPTNMEERLYDGKITRPEEYVQLFHNVA
jgi:hypothetical protein